MTEKTAEQAAAVARYVRIAEAMDEFSDSFTGFDEAAIIQHFGDAAADLSEKNFAMFARAIVFVMKRRAGANDDDARNEVMNMTNKSVQATLEDLVDESEAVDASGKGDEPPASPPVTLLPSAL